MTSPHPILPKRQKPVTGQQLYYRHQRQNPMLKLQVWRLRLLNWLRKLRRKEQKSTREGK